MSGPVADQRAADGAGDLCCNVTGQAVDTLVDEEIARGVQVQRVAPGLAVERGQAHGALLLEVDKEQPFQRAARAPTASLRMMTQASERSISLVAAAKARTPRGFPDGLDVACRPSHGPGGSRR